MCHFRKSVGLDHFIAVFFSILGLKPDFPLENARPNDRERGGREPLLATELARRNPPGRVGSGFAACIRRKYLWGWEFRHAA